MVRLVVGTEGIVLDPACGVGTLLLRAESSRGQEINETNALLSAVRVLLRGAEARIVAGDSLREDGLTGELADAVVCDPPFNERAGAMRSSPGTRAGSTACRRAGSPSSPGCSTASPT